MSSTHLSPSLNRSISKDGKADVLKSGVLFYRKKEGKKDWKEAYFAVNGVGEIQYWKTAKQAKTDKPKATIHLSSAGVLEYKDSIKEWAVIISPKDPKSKEKPIHIAFSSQAEFRDWLSVIKNAQVGEKQDLTTVQIEEKLRNNNYVLDPNDILFDSDVLGKGASGIVKKARWMKTTDVAIKALNNMPEFIDQSEITQFFKEIEVLSQLRHPNIVSMFGYAKKDGFLCLVTQYIKGGDLSKGLKDSSKKLDLRLQTEFAVSITAGMIYLHKNGVIHRDLKPGNILVDSWDEAKLLVCDFGLSGFISKASKKGENQGGMVGSPAYAAPELQEANHDNKVDVFSFGVILWQIHTRLPLWPGIASIWDILENVRAGKRMEIPKGSIFENLISKCWDQDPKKRPSFEEVYTDLENLKLQLKRNSSPFQDMIAKGFTKGESLTWSEFSNLCVVTLGVAPRALEDIKWLVEKDGHVKLADWNNLLKWFSPLIATETYHSSGVADDDLAEIGYTMDEIAAMVKPNWFFGYLDTMKARQLLINKQPGSFLLRFSQNNVGAYTLSVLLENGTIGNWRCTVEKLHKTVIQYRLEGHIFGSFHEMIEKFSIIPLKSATDKSTPEARLKTPLDRHVDK